MLSGYSVTMVAFCSIRSAESIGFERCKSRVRIRRFSRRKFQHRIIARDPERHVVLGDKAGNGTGFGERRSRNPGKTRHDCHTRQTRIADGRLMLPDVSSKISSVLSSRLLPEGSAIVRLSGSVMMTSKINVVYMRRTQRNPLFAEGVALMEWRAHQINPLCTRGCDAGSKVTNIASYISSIPTFLYRQLDYEISSISLRMMELLSHSSCSAGSMPPRQVWIYRRDIFISG